MSLHPIHQAAFDYANRARERETLAKAEKERLLVRLEQLELEIPIHKAAADRLFTFQQSRNGVFQCPRCWIAQEIAADLTPIPSVDEDDKFRCTHCRDEFAVPV